MTSSIQVTVKKIEPMTVASLSMKGPYTQISEAFSKLYGWIAEKGYVPAGPPLGVYFNAPGQVPDSELLWEVRSPIVGDIHLSRPDERGVGVKRLKSTQVAATMHKGPFDELGKTYEALAAWIIENGYEIAGPAEEVYLSDPQKTRPEELLTEVRFPVRRK